MTTGLLADETVRRRVETLALNCIMLGAGASVGIVWSYATLVRYGPRVPPAWMADVVSHLQVLLYAALGVLAVGGAGMLVLFWRANTDALGAGTEL